MRSLTALRPILYGARQYGAGDLLPTDNAAMVDAWITAGSAGWKEEGEDAQPKKPKAKAATATPGLAGISSTGNQEDLVGRIPETGERQRAKRGGRK